MEARPIAEAIAAVLIEGFDKHYRLFRKTTGQAKGRFERAAGRGSARCRSESASTTSASARTSSGCAPSSISTLSMLPPGGRSSSAISGLLVDHHQPELAETFFNSVITRILRRTYSDNDLIFVRATISTEQIESDPPIYRSYYPGESGRRECFRRLFGDFGWAVPFADLERDLDRLLEAVGEPWAHLEPNHQIQVLGSAFYRNKAAYVLGKIVNGHQELPFVVPVLHDEDGRLALDAIVLEAERISILFSLSRAYFMVDMEVPSGYVHFLRTMTPARAPAELYTMIGLGKQGKTLLYRDLLQHLHHSEDTFVEAPGVRGQVMLVFTLPSYPYVIKVIKDVFGPGKNTDRATVRSKFEMVKHVDRVGRLADTLEFTALALPLERFSLSCSASCASLAPSMIEVEGDSLVIHHCYVERRMIPLNIYLDRATPEEIEPAVLEYGNAIRELAIANIFPGDLLWRNFGVTRYGRVIFYDFDEIDYLTDITFRRIPPPPNPEAELSDEPWYGVARNDVFPEEFATFLLGDLRLREAFLHHHAELLEPEFWRECQRRVESGETVDFFPYPESLRFCNREAPEARAATGG